VSIRVVLRNPRREVEVAGNRRVKDVLRDLDILPETVLVIRGDDLVTADQMLRDDDVIELRPVMSGGSGPRASRTGHLRSHSGSPRASNALWLRTATPASRSPLQ
jgi:sulfur carrier protein